MASDSSCLRPTMLRVNWRLTKSAFFPVTGWVRTTGWTGGRHRQYVRYGTEEGEERTVGDGLALDDATAKTLARVLGLLDAGVNRRECLEVATEGRRQVYWTNIEGG